MDSDDLVRSIASEVIKRLNGDKPQGPSPVRAQSSPAAPAAQLAGQRTLILLSGGDGRLDEALVQVGRLAEGSKSATVVLSTSAKRIIGLPAVRRAAPEALVLTEGEVERILEGVDAIYLPNMSLNAASKIGHLCPDSLVCILAIQGLLRGLPVTAARDSLVPAGVDPARVPAGVRARIDGLLDALRQMGVRVCAVTELAGAAGRGAVQGDQGCASSACTHGTADGCSGCGQCVEQQTAAVKELVNTGAARVGAAMGTRPASADMAGMIDHTLLKPDATEADIRVLCEEARQHLFASVCVNPAWVSLAARLLAGSPVRVCTVIGFPLGATTPTAKGIETRDAIANGATEIDMVINVGALKSGDDELVRRDIEAVVNAARGQGLVKVILETALLSREEKVKGCLLAKMAGADFVKTSTGFSSGGATVEDIALMRETVGPDMGVKASGGIRDRETADAMVAAGATRIGASASVAIATGQKAKAGGY